MDKGYEEKKKTSFQEYTQKTSNMAKALETLSLSLTKEDFVVTGGEHGTEKANKHLRDIAAVAMETQIVMLRYDYIGRRIEQLTRRNMKYWGGFRAMKKAYEDKLTLLRQMYQTIKENVDEYTASL